MAIAQKVIASQTYNQKMCFVVDQSTCTFGDFGTKGIDFNTANSEGASLNISVFVIYARLFI